MITILDLIHERGGWCECGCHRPADDMHHCLVHTSKRYRDILTVKYNLMLLSRECHSSGHWNSFEGRKEFWQIQCKRYGRQVMLDWINGLPMKIKRECFE